MAKLPKPKTVTPWSTKLVSRATPGRSYLILGVEDKQNRNLLPVYVMDTKDAAYIAACANRAPSMEALNSLDSAQLKYYQKEEREIRDVLDRHNVPTNGEGGHRKRQTYTTLQRVKLLAKMLQVAEAAPCGQDR